MFYSYLLIIPFVKDLNTEGIVFKSSQSVIIISDFKIKRLGNMVTICYIVERKHHTGHNPGAFEGNNHEPPVQRVV
jgi:hypothetical protein